MNMNWKFFGVASLGVLLFIIPTAIKMELPLWGALLLIGLLEICVLIACISKR